MNYYSCLNHDTHGYSGWIKILRDLVKLYNMENCESADMGKRII